MTRASALLLLLLSATGCAHRPEAAANPTAVATPQCPALDPARMQDLVQVDRENQEQLTKVDELTARVARLQQALTDSLRRGAVSTNQAVVSSEGNKVRVRMSSELVFSSASARITREGRDALTQLAGVIKETPAKHIEIAGHTDSQPINKKYADNLDLSVQRAHRVAQFLISLGVDGRRLMLTGYGDTEPVDGADTEDARAKNRRVEIFIEPGEARPGTP